MMLKDLLEKFDKEFDEKFTDNGNGWSNEWIYRDGGKLLIEAMKSLAHSHIEAAYHSNLERLIAKCGDEFGGLERTCNYLGQTLEWCAFQTKLDGKDKYRVGSTPTEAVENLIKALEK